MAGTRAFRRDRIGAVLIGTLLALSVVAGTAGLVTAHGEDDDHIVRTGDDLEITLGDEHFDNDDRNITVRVDGGKSETLSPDETADNQSTYTVPVARLSASNTDLSNASVTVEPANGTEITESEDLRLVQFDGNGEPSFGDDGTLQVALSQALGYTDGDEVAATLAGDSEPIADASVQYENDTAVLRVSLAAEQVHLPPSKGTTLSATRGDETELNLWQLSLDVTSVERLDDQRLIVDSPLFGGGIEYDLVVVNPETNATFASAVTASDEETLTVTDETLVSSDELLVSAYRNGNAVFEGVEYERTVEPAESATVTENGTAVVLTKSSFEMDETTVWLANSTDYVQATVGVDGNTLNLSSAGYRLNKNASYRLLVSDGAEIVRAIVAGDQAANDSENDSLVYAAAVPNDSGNESNTTADAGSDGGEGAESDDGSDGPITTILDQGPIVLVGGGISVLLVLFVAVVVVIRLTGDDSPADGSQANSGAATTKPTHEVECQVTDAATGSAISAEVRAKQKRKNTPHQSGGASDETLTLSNGKGSMTLEEGEWAIEAKSHGVSDRKRAVDVHGKTQLPFELGPKQVGVTVTDDNRNPISDVSVTCTSDAGREQTGRTNRNGEVSFDVALATDEVKLAASPEKYDNDTATVSVADGSSATTLNLRPSTGKVELPTTVAGTPIAGIPVELRPQEDGLRRLGETERTATSDEDGVASFEGLLVGEYEAVMDAPGEEAYAVTAERVQVRDGRVARQTLDASFEFSLSRNQRDRIRSVRQDVDALVSATGRDVAIPRYYGSVVTALLDTIERLPREGDRFATADADPNMVTNALIDAAESSVRVIEDAMTTKRNTDLFGACVDMPDQRVEWRGQFDVATLFELLAADRKDQRQTMLTQLRAVDDRINDERSALAGVSPARELWDGVKEFVNQERGDDAVRGAAVAFAAGGLLDSVNELFDHAELRERLERTVF